MDTNTGLDTSFFLFLLQSNIETLGVEKAKAQLIQIGEHIAESMVKRFPADSLSAKEITEDAIFLLERCPFEEPIHAYLEIEGEMASSLVEITKKYNEGEASSATSPYCIIHQAIRHALSNKMKIGGKPCELLQLGCKGGKGMVSMVPTNIKSVALTVEGVVSRLKTTACAYAVRKKK
jgi:hypothetical protein